MIFHAVSSRPLMSIAMAFLDGDLHFSNMLEIHSIDFTSGVIIKDQEDGRGPFPTDGYLTF